MAVRISSASSGVMAGSKTPTNSEKEGTLFIPSLKYVGLRRVEPSVLDAGVEEVGIEDSGCAVARDRDVYEGLRVTLLEICRKGGAFKQRNRLTAAIVVNPHTECWRLLGDIIDWK